MDGHQYEYQCAKNLKKRGFSKVEVTKGSGDQGIDIIAHSGRKRYGIQCKYYSSPVGNFAVQEAFAGAKFYDCNIAVVLTNNTFTPAAKELAEKTGVLLWEKDKIPNANNSFWLTKIIGIVFCVFGILGLLTVWNMDDAKLPILQSIELVFLILAGFFAVFEYRNWGMSLSSSLFYLLAAFVNIIFYIVTLRLPNVDCVIYIMIALISFFRADYLHNKTNKFHIWQNRPKDFDYNLTIHASPNIDEAIQPIKDGLNRVKELAEIINTTTDIIEFESSLSEIKIQLKALSECEDLGIFQDSTPSQDLEKIIKNEELTRKNFQERLRLHNSQPSEPRQGGRKH